MSATLNASLFANYFGGKVPVIKIPGRTFPVQQVFLEDALELTGYVLEDGSPYAQRNNAKDDRGKKFGGLRKEVFKGGNMKGVFLDEYELAKDLGGDDGRGPPKESVWDEKLTARQIEERYAGLSEASIRTLALMDHSKIDYDMVRIC